VTPDERAHLASSRHHNFSLREIAMRTHQSGMFSNTSALLLGTSLLIGCNDEVTIVGRDDGMRLGTSHAALEALGPVTEASASLLTNVNDIRGLTYAADGKIYASGHVGATTSVDRTLAVLRFEADGTPDGSFGTGGLVQVNVTPRVVDELGAVVNDGTEESLGIVELASGELVVQVNARDAAGRGIDVALVKLTATGELVSGFGDGGVRRLDLGWSPSDDAAWPVAGAAPSDQSWGLALDKSTDVEKVVVFAHGPAKVGAVAGTPAVQRTDNDRYIARLLASDGSLDPAFNQGSVFTLNTGGTFSDGGRRGFVDPDGSIVSAGYTNFGDSFGNHIVVIRLRANGTPDPNFKSGIALPGVVRANPFIEDGGVAECYGIGKQSTGRYITTGYGRATAANAASSLGWATTDAVDLVSVGFTSKGLDASYGSGASLAIQSEEYALGNTEDRGRDLVVLGDDRVVHVGRFGPNPAIFVTLPDGQPDFASGIEGRFEFDALTSPTSHFFKAALSPDGKQIVATTSNHADGVLLAILNVSEVESAPAEADVAAEEPSESAAATTAID
jgi:uncharacterized delta-60 repeat protein